MKVFITVWEKKVTEYLQSISVRKFVLMIYKSEASTFFRIIMLLVYYLIDRNKLLNFEPCLYFKIILEKTKTISKIVMS